MLFFLGDLVLVSSSSFVSSRRGFLAAGGGAWALSGLASSSVVLALCLRGDVHFAGVGGFLFRVFGLAPSLFLGVIFFSQVCPSR